MKRADTRPAPTLLMRTALTFVLIFVAAIAPACRREQPPTTETNTAAFGLAASGRENLCQQEKYARSPLPQPTGLVNDFAGVIDAESEGRLSKQLAALQKEGEIDFAVVTVKTTGGVHLFDYSMSVACGWDVGGKRGGLLLLVAVEDQKWHFQVSRALEKDLTGEVVRQIGGRMTESFRADGFGEGIELGVEEIVHRLNERRVRDATQRRNIPTH